MANPVCAGAQRVPLIFSCAFTTLLTAATAIAQQPPPPPPEAGLSLDLDVIEVDAVTVIDTTAELLGRAKPRRPRARASVQRKAPVKKAAGAASRGRSRKAAATDDDGR